MKLQDAFEVWLNSDTELSFLDWIKERELTIVGEKKIFGSIDLSKVDLVKVEA